MASPEYIAITVVSVVQRAAEGGMKTDTVLLFLQVWASNHLNPLWFIYRGNIVCH